jgi:hypothetical protein
MLEPTNYIASRLNIGFILFLNKWHAKYTSWFLKFS